MTLFDQAYAYAHANPTPSTGEPSWAGMCGSLMFRFGEATTPGWNPQGDISSADSVSRCSGTLYPFAAEAPVGAFHFYRDGGDGHVQVDLKGGGTEVFHASGVLDTVWGSAIGTVNVWTYLNNRPQMQYVGWSMNYAGATLQSFAAPAPVVAPPVVAPPVVVTPPALVVVPEQPTVVVEPAVVGPSKPVIELNSALLGNAVDVVVSQIAIFLPLEKRKKVYSWVLLLGALALAVTTVSTAIAPAIGGQVGMVLGVVALVSATVGTLAGTAAAALARANAADRTQTVQTEVKNG